MHAHVPMYDFYFYSTFYKGFEALYKRFEAASTIVYNLGECLKILVKFYLFSLDPPVTFSC